MDEYVQMHVPCAHMLRTENIGLSSFHSSASFLEVESLTQAKVAIFFFSPSINKPQGFSRPAPHRTGVTNVCGHAWLSMWVLRNRTWAVSDLMIAVSTLNC